MIRRDANGLTPTQARVYNLLLDGKWHSQQEMMRAIDDYADKDTLIGHIKKMKPILRDQGILINCSKERGTHYCLARVFVNDNG